MTTATRDFIIKASSGLLVTALASFAGAFVGLYVASAKTETQLANIEHEIQRHDVRIERLERRSEDQGRELAKLSNLLPYSVYQAMDAPHKALSEITKAIDLINKVPSMTPDEKRQQIDSLYFQAIEVANFGNKVFEVLQPDIERLKQRAEEK